MKKFGRLVKKKRVAKGISREELGNIVGLSRVAITDIEKGKFNILAVNAIRISRVLRIPTKDMCESLLPVKKVRR